MQSYIARYDHRTYVMTFGDRGYRYDYDPKVLVVAAKSPEHAEKLVLQVDPDAVNINVELGVRG